MWSAVECTRRMKNVFCLPLFTKVSDRVSEKTNVWKIVTEPEETKCLDSCNYIIFHIQFAYNNNNLVLYVVDVANKLLYGL